MKADSIYSEWICFPLICKSVYIISFTCQKGLLSDRSGACAISDRSRACVIPIGVRSYVMLVLFKLIIGGRPMCMSGTKRIAGRANTGMSCFLLAEKILEKWPGLRVCPGN